MTVQGGMFIPGNRHEWTSLVRPPAGYRLEGALGTTFCLDFTALTALLIGSLDQESAQVNWDNRAQLLQMITRLGDRVRVLVHRGQIHAEVRPANKVFALLDGIVGEVRHGKGYFHPKVWVLKYSPRKPIFANTRRGRNHEAVEPVYRLLCTSRNLTLASTWEAVICLEGRIASADQSRSLDVGRQVSAFFEMCTATGYPLSSPLQRLLKELKHVAFATDGNKAVQSCELLWQHPGTAGIANRVDTGGKAALVVAPFMRSGFLRFLAKAFKKVIVVSRQEELDALWSDEIERLIPIDHFWVVRSSDGDEGVEAVPALELHAKLLLCEYPKRASSPWPTEAWLGSANGSTNGWGMTAPWGRMNCEAMMRFAPGIRPEQFLAQFAYREGSAPASEGLVLNGWIEPYQPRPVEELSEEDGADRLLDAVVEGIGGLELRVRFERGADQVALVLEVHDTESWRRLFAKHQEVTFDICPLGIANERPFQDLARLLAGVLRFEDLTMAQVGAFMLVRLTHVATGRSKQFVVKADTEVSEGFWNERREAFLQENLDAKDFRQFLRFILFGDALPHEPRIQHAGSGIDNEDNDVKGRQHLVPSLFDDFTVEDILQSCTEDRSRIEEVDRLLEAVGATQHVDASFRAFWTNFRKAVRLEEEHRPQ